MADHKRLVLPGPVEVRKEILDAQSQWMIGHRSDAFADLYADLQTKLKRAFVTENRVYVVGSSGTGVWELASRNGIRDDRRVLHCIGGSFSDRWAKVSRANGKQVDTVEVEWGLAVRPEMVADALEHEDYDAVCVVHNETSTGVTNPIQAIGEVVREHDDTLFMVDTVSGFLGAELRVDEWGIDLALTSAQKAFALPPGVAFATISERMLKRAEEVENRGYYFDVLTLEKYYQRNNTPSTPPISLLWAANQQLTDIFEGEGLEGRWQRHRQLQDITASWVVDRGFGFFAEEGYRSPTITAVANAHEIDVYDMAAFMAEHEFAMDKGYGKIRGETFRIAHMGDMSVAMLEDVLTTLDEFIS